MGSLAAYVTSMADAVGREKGKKLGGLLRAGDAGAITAAMEAGQMGKGIQGVERLVRGRVRQAGVETPFDDTIVQHVRTLYCIAVLDHMEAYSAAVAALQSLMKAWKEEESGWLNESMWSLASNVRSMASAADRDLMKRGQAPMKLSEAATVLRKCFSDAQKGNTREQKAATLEIVNQLFRIFFKLNTLGQCKHLVRTVEQKTFPPFKTFNASQRVTYSFYAGRLCVFHDEFETAEKHLMYALRHCHRAHVSHKKKIMEYLVPVRMLRGHMPRPQLLHRYKLDCYQGITTAIRFGDLRAFDNTMEEYMLPFIRAGTYLLIEKLRMVAYRSLLKRIFDIRTATADLAHPHHIRLELFCKALRWLGADFASEESSLDEIECIVANLIYRKYVKGYISHSKRTLVVAKKDPMPSISTVPVPAD